MFMLAHELIKQNPIIRTELEKCVSALLSISEFCIELSEDLDNQIELLTARSGVPLSTQKEQFSIIPRY